MTVTLDQARTDIGAILRAEPDKRAMCYYTDAYTQTLPKPTRPECVVGVYLNRNLNVPLDLLSVVDGIEASTILGTTPESVAYLDDDKCEAIDNIQSAVDVPPEVVDFLNVVQTYQDGRGDDHGDGPITPTWGEVADHFGL